MKNYKNYKKPNFQNNNTMFCVPYKYRKRNITRGCVPSDREPVRRWRVVPVLTCTREVAAVASRRRRNAVGTHCAVALSLHSW